MTGGSFASTTSARLGCFRVLWVPWATSLYPTVGRKDGPRWPEVARGGRSRLGAPGTAKEHLKAAAHRLWAAQDLLCFVHHG